MAQPKACSPTCSAFKCTQNSTVYRDGTVWCRWTEEMCNVSNCTYAICVKRRLLPKGVCGETVKRKTVDRLPEDDFGESVKLRGKTLRKIGEKEIF